MSPTSFQTAPSRDIFLSLSWDKWMEVDSNHRSNLQQIYSLSPLATRESIQILTYEIVNITLFIQCKADDRTRTDNLLITNQLLCQLSHIGLKKWDLQGSNLWPSACKADALPAELRSHFICHEVFFMNDPEGTRTLDLRRDRAAL